MLEPFLCCSCAWNDASLGVWGFPSFHLLFHRPGLWDNFCRLAQKMHHFRWFSFQWERLIQNTFDQG